MPENLDNGHLDWYFFLLAGLMALTMVYFYYISLDYEYKTHKDLSIFDDDEEDDGTPLTQGQIQNIGSKKSGEDNYEDRESESDVSNSSSLRFDEIRNSSNSFDGAARVSSTRNSRQPSSVKSHSLPSLSQTSSSNRVSSAVNTKGTSPRVTTTRNSNGEGIAFDPNSVYPDQPAENSAQTNNSNSRSSHVDVRNMLLEAYDEGSRAKGEKDVEEEES